MTNPLTPLVENVFIPFLNFSYSVIPNYGIAVIILTLLIKIIFYPLSKKQFASMQANQKLQPEVKKIQEKYKDDPKKAQAEIMKLWKDNNANPFTGCLPTLVQIPFFFAIFATMTSPKFLALLKGPNINPGFDPFWLTNLALPDPFTYFRYQSDCSPIYHKKCLSRTLNKQVYLFLCPLLCPLFV